MCRFRPTDADALFAEYADIVYRLAFLRTKSGTDADDIVQEVFLRALRAKPVWNSLEHQKAWFLKVTINCTKSLPDLRLAAKHRTGKRKSPHTDADDH